MNPATDYEPAPRPDRNDGARRLTEHDSAADQRSLGELAEDIWQKADTLIRQELSLALADAEDRARALHGELTEQVSELKVELFARVLGGAVMYAGLLSVIAAVVLAFAKLVDPWVSAAIVGAVIAAAGFALMKSKLKAGSKTHFGARDLVPRRAVESTKRDVKAIEETIK